MCATLPKDKYATMSHMPYVCICVYYAIYSLCPLYVLFSIALPATFSLCHIPEYTFPICSIFYSIVPASPIHHIFPIYIYIYALYSRFMYYIFHACVLQYTPYIISPHSILFVSYKNYYDPYLLPRSAGRSTVGLSGSLSGLTRMGTRWGGIGCPSAFCWAMVFQVIVIIAMVCRCICTASGWEGHC